jgi:hypothetical protein
MRIRYIKPEGDGVEADLPDASARRLIDSGAAEAVDPEQASTEDSADQAAEARPAAKKAAKKSGRSK